MQTAEVVEKIVETIQAAPERAQDFIANPKDAIAAVAPQAVGVDIHAVIQGVVARAGELGLDLSCVDLSKLDLSQIDVSKLDLLALKSAADKCHIDMSKLDPAAVRAAAASFLSSLGGLFSR